LSTDPSSLAEPLRSATFALLREANAGRARVAVVSARRSRSEQIGLRRAHCGASDYDVFTKPSGECTPPTARPGESQHELGLAVDFGGDLGLVAELAPKHELVATVAGEPWHYEHRSTARGAGAGDGASPSATTTSGGGGGSLVGSALGNVPLIGGALSSAWDWKDALGNLAGAITNPKFWLRALGALVGFWLVAIGFLIVARDATSSTTEPVDMTYSAVV
jgi:hypothetical protein